MDLKEKIKIYMDRLKSIQDGNYELKFNFDESARIDEVEFIKDSEKLFILSSFDGVGLAGKFYIDGQKEIEIEVFKIAVEIYDIFMRHE
jgi:hypothetical protein